MPMLERGLAVLQAVATHRHGLSYNEILGVVDAPTASLARVIRYLKQARYLTKDETDGRYYLGPAMAIFSHGTSIPEKLRAVGQPVLDSVVTATACSVSLVYHNPSDEEEFLAKALHPNAPSMQLLGSHNKVSFGTPCGWLFADPEHPPAGEHPEFTERYREATARLGELGYVFDDQYVLPGIRRLAAPIRNQQNTVAALMTAAHITALTDDLVHATGQHLIEAAASIATAMGW